MKGFIRLPNNFYSYALSPKAVFTYCYLTAACNSFRAKTITYAELAARLHCDSKTAQSAIKELLSSGLISKENRYGTLGYKANRYYVKPLNLKSGFFTVCREAFDTNISAVEFTVYVAIQRCRSTKTDAAVPSKTALSAMTGLSERSCDKAVKYLIRFSFVSMKQRKYQKTQAFRSNEYKNRVFDISAQKEKPSAYTEDHSNSIIKIHLFGKLVNSFIAFVGEILRKIKRRCRGGAYFPKHYLDAQENITSRKEESLLYFS